MKSIIKKVIKANEGLNDQELLNWSMNQLFRAARAMDLTFRPDLKVYIGGCDATATVILKKLIKTKRGWDLIYLTNPKLLRGHRKPHMLSCYDCGCMPWDMGEDFYVNDKLWKKIMPLDGIVCVGCFEKRLGRQLTLKDFKPWFRKNRWYGDQRRKLNEPLSKRLAERLKLRA